MNAKVPTDSKKVSLSGLKCVIKHNSIKKSYRNGKMTVILEGLKTDSVSLKPRVDSFGNSITSEKKHRIQICEEVKVIEVENWKFQNQVTNTSSKCSICSIM